MKILCLRWSLSRPENPGINGLMLLQKKLQLTCFTSRQVFALCAFFVLFCIKPHRCNSQSINLSDSLRQVFQNVPVPTIKIDTRNSFITGQSARIYGVKLGLSYGKRLSLGLGYNWLQSEIKDQISLPTGTVEGVVKLKYIAPFIDYSFYKKGPWEANIPVQIGFGRSYVQVSENTGNSHLAMDNVILYEPTMTVEYKILNVIGLGGGIGYRIMLKNNDYIDHQFSSPVYVLRFRLIFDELYKQAKQYRNNSNE